MKSITTGTISGCIIWFIVFGIISMCLIPVVMAVGGITSVSNFAIRITGGYICPDGTTAETYSYATTTVDEYGNHQPSTAYVLQCVDGSGDVVKEDPIAYAFMWIGILTGIGLVVAGLLAFLLAAPAGALIARLFKQNKGNNQPMNIEPR
jgi:hypothetical protein